MLTVKFLILVRLSADQGLIPARARASKLLLVVFLILSVSDAVGERSAPAPELSRQFEPLPAAVHEPEPEPEPVFAGASSRNSYGAEREHTLGGRVIGSQIPPYSPSAFPAPASQAASPSLTPWVSAPLAEPDRVIAQTVSIPARPSASSWLQAPMRSSGVSPWRKVVRWLQAPAGH